MIWDAEAYAEGICNSAAGSSIEGFVMYLDLIIEDIIDDAVEYRRADPDDDQDSKDAINDNEQAESYREVETKLLELRNAIVQREKDNGESTYFEE